MDADQENVVSAGLCYLPSGGPGRGILCCALWHRGCVRDCVNAPLCPAPFQLGEDGFLAPLVKVEVHRNHLFSVPSVVTMSLPLFCLKEGLRSNVAVLSQSTLLPQNIWSLAGFEVNIKTCMTQKLAASSQCPVQDRNATHCPILCSIFRLAVTSVVPSCLLQAATWLSGDH